MTPRWQTVSGWSERTTLSMCTTGTLHREKPIFSGSIISIPKPESLKDMNQSWQVPQNCCPSLPVTPNISATDMAMRFL
jgi:hypothetical protein